MRTRLNAQIFLLFASGLSALVLSSCESTVPTESDFAHFQKVAELRSQEHKNSATRAYQQGLISKEEYEQRLAYIDANFNNLVSDLVWQNHRLKEQQRENLGIPTGGVRDNLSGFGTHNPQYDALMVPRQTAPQLQQSGSSMSPEGTHGGYQSRF